MYNVVDASIEFLGKSPAKRKGAKLLTTVNLKSLCVFAPLRETSFHPRIRSSLPATTMLIEMMTIKTTP